MSTTANSTNVGSTVYIALAFYLKRPGPFEEEREPKESLTQEVWQLRKARLDDPRMYDRLAIGWFRLGTLPQYLSDDLAYGQTWPIAADHRRIQ